MIPMRKSLVLLRRVPRHFATAVCVNNGDRRIVPRGRIPLDLIQILDSSAQTADGPLSRSFVGEWITPIAARIVLYVVSCSWNSRCGGVSSTRRATCGSIADPGAGRRVPRAQPVRPRVFRSVR